MTLVLPVTCRQMAYLILLGCFILGNGLLMLSNYTLGSDAGFFGGLLFGFSVVFGGIAIVIYIADNKLIRCKCDE